ncbi:MAG: peptide chain release factor N(5)-glutamine methyltransferase [Faecousia sp.]
MVKTYAELYLDAKKRLEETEGQQAGSVARDLLCFASGKGRAEMLAHRADLAPEGLHWKLDELVNRVRYGEPLAYILGEWEFYGLPLFVTRDVLIPRDDTCAVTELAIRKALFFGQDPRILDLCTGSGCIGLAIASRVHDAHLTLGDVSREALAVAKRNAAANGLTSRVYCMRVDAMEPAQPILGRFDLIVSNPPYITAGEMEALPVSVKDYEPHLALFGGEDGLDFYRAIVKNYKPALKPGGYLCFEFGMGQGDRVCAILEEAGFAIEERTKDYNGIERAVSARLAREDS